MRTPATIALKNGLIGLLAIIAGGACWGLIRGRWPDFAGLGAVGAVLGMSVAWAAQEAYAARRTRAEAVGPSRQ